MRASIEAWIRPLSIVAGGLVALVFGIAGTMWHAQANPPPPRPTCFKAELSIRHIGFWIEGGPNGPMACTSQIRLNEADVQHVERVVCVEMTPCEDGDAHD